MKENLVIIVGAGASIKAGIPSTADLLDVARKALPELLEPRIEYLIAGNAAYTLPRKVKLSDILDQALRGAYGTYDFELLLNALEELQAAVAAREMPTLLPEYRQVLSAFTDLFPRVERIADSQLLENAQKCVINAIHRYVGDRCAHPSVHPSSVPDPARARKQLQRLIHELAKSYRLVVVTLNYDDVIESTDVPWGDGFGDIATWTTQYEATKDPLMSEKRCHTFSPELWRKQVADPACNLLIHLHGSIRFGWVTFTEDESLSRAAEPGKYKTHQEASDSLDKSFGGSADNVGGQIVEGTPIISGRQKGSKLIYNPRPYGYYYATTMNLIPVTPNLLVLGYGWHDIHLNTWIEEMLKLQKKRRVGVVTHLSRSEVGDMQVPQNKYLQLMVRDHSRLRHNVCAGQQVTNGGSDFFRDGEFAVLPSGFEITEIDERQLVTFMTA